MTEAELQRIVCDALTFGGWLWMHQRPGRTSTGWRTAIEGTAGFPDLIALRGERVLVLEVKSETGRISIDQRRWIEAWRRAGIDARIIRPVDVDRLIGELIHTKESR